MNWSRKQPKQAELIPSTDEAGRPTRIETRTHEEFLSVCVRLDAGEFRLTSFEFGSKTRMDFPGNASAVFRVWYQ